MNIRKLVREADAGTVAEHIGMELKIKGSAESRRVNILCPGHEARLNKPDVHYGNAILLRDGYECYACGVRVKTKDMVMEYLGCSSSEAYIIMAEAMGGVELFEDSADELQQEIIPDLRLSEHEANVLKLWPKFRCIVAVKKDKEGTFPIQDGLYILYKSNPYRYYRLIVQRAEEMLQNYEYCMRHFSSVNSDLAYVLYDLQGEGFDHSIFYRIKKELDERIDICKKIINIFSSRI